MYQRTPGIVLLQIYVSYVGWTVGELSLSVTNKFTHSLINKHADTQLC